ncbi:MAG TPA: DNA cytosine methyltransferase [Protaetiibacter sp.]|nr:DNA cytosine methyltransferase [Protaetiibacter sp.]
MRVLNAYAGIGGNRHLWPAEWRVTAVEIDERVAAEYSRRYPDDEVIVSDAHAFVLERSEEFDGTWSSPPCPTHSKLARVNASKHGRPLEPDPRLWVEIAHLRSTGRPFVVENVHTYYEPPIPPDLVTDRHYYWMSRVPVMLTPVPSAGMGFYGAPTAGEYAELYGLPPIPPRTVPDARKAMKNAVVPIEGLEVALAAFSRVLESQDSGPEPVTGRNTP